MNDPHNRFHPRRLVIIALIGVAVMIVLGMTEAALRELVGYPYAGPIAGAGGGIIIAGLLFVWRGGYPKQT